MLEQIFPAASKLLGFGKLISGRSARVRPWRWVVTNKEQGKRQENVYKQMIFHEVTGICFTTRRNCRHPVER